MRSEAAATQRRLLHIRDNVHLAAGFVESMVYETFRDDIRTLYAVTRCLEIISEASRHLPAELKARHPSIAWKEWQAPETSIVMITRTWRPRRVWSAIRKDLPPLLAAVETELAKPLT